jgi:hypothetical protein
MLSSQLILLCVMLVPSVVSADAVFAEDSLVKMLEPDSFQSALKPNVTISRLLVQARF